MLSSAIVCAVYGKACFCDSYMTFSGSKTYTNMHDIALTCVQYNRVATVACLLIHYAPHIDVSLFRNKVLP